MNIRRTIAIAVLAGGITLTPAAAFAYIAPSPDSGTIPPRPTPSETTSTPTKTTPPKTGTVVVENTRTPEKTGTVTTEAELLSATGFAGTTMALGAGVLLLAGATTVIVAARRNEPEDAQ
ncbi:hypothetical protein [Demequina phytophila]|uniref:hypothetical protein n=1 Tax=Demequina phytophila TaxID=1638981 RepID=UPI0007829B8D|nr:hypothetical protein [Demequina phytophila]